MATATLDKQCAPKQRPRLIVADDDPFVRSMLPAQLESAFDCVGTAADAAAAVELVAVERPDIVILDVNMPRGGAIRATREIAARCPGTVIVILSGDEARDGVIDLLEAGASSYLRKGVDPRELAQHLRAALGIPHHGSDGCATSVPRSLSAARHAGTAPASHEAARAIVESNDPAMPPSLPTVVLADDDAVALMLLAEQLGGLFDCVGSVSDADAAVALIAAHKPDIAILDVNMPSGGATAATPRIRLASPATAIVILSVDETHEQVVELMELGATTYLRKGVDSPTLIAKLLASIQAHRSLYADQTIAFTA